MILECTSYHLHSIVLTSLVAFNPYDDIDCCVATSLIGKTYYVGRMGMEITTMASLHQQSWWDGSIFTMGEGGSHA